MRRALLAAAALSLAFGAAAAKTTATLTATDAVIRPAPAGLPTTAAYLTLTNRSARPVRLMGVACACAAEVSAHESDTVGGVMRMRAAGAVVIPAHGSVSFAPGGLHLMVMGLRAGVKAGTKVPMTLRFDHAAPLTVTFAAKR